MKHMSPLPFAHSPLSLSHHLFPRVTCYLLLITTFSLLLTSCTTTTSTATPQPIRVEYTPATTPWLADLYACTDNDVVDAEPRSADFLDYQGEDLVMRIGQPDELTTPAYQVGSENINVIVNSDNPLRTLTLEQVRGLFSGQISGWREINGPNTPVQVWVYDSGEDVQQIFDYTALGGSPVTSTARLAADPDEMVQAIAADVNAVGILTGHWPAEGISDVLTVTSVPVLAITPSQPPAEINNILACMQK
jgi:hypothetical protein